MPDAANRQHYEVPDELFRLMLGPRLKYSSCWWAPEVADLAGAEDAMLELTCARAGLADGMRILELGCGWGSLTLWMAQRYPGARITAVSNSASQREFIERACRDRGLGNVTVHTGNVAEVDPGGPFDRIVSVEMFEHMRNWSALLTRMAGWLAPGGEVFLHVFCHHRWAYPFRTDRPGAWMARTFFTGGLMPAFDLPRAPILHTEAPYYYRREEMGQLAQGSGRTVASAYKTLQRIRQALLVCMETSASPGASSP